MNAFEWFTKYIGIQGILAIGFFVVFLVMSLRGQNMNPEFFGILGIIVGFYFAKNGHNINEDIKNNRRRK